MTKFKKKIDQYNSELENIPINNTHLEETIAKVNNIVANGKKEKTTYIEFIFNQSRFIQKRWWLLQALLLVLIGLIINDFYEAYIMNRFLAVSSALFIILIIPEIWKNRNNLSCEIEGVSYYSLKQIYAARIILFSVVDITLLTLFILYFNIDLKLFIIDFLIPLNVSAAICYECLIDNRKSIIFSYVGIIAWTFLLEMKRTLVTLVMR